MQPLDEASLVAAVKVRCPGCGGMTSMPCVLCRLRNYQSHSHDKPEWDDSRVCTGVILFGEARDRYEVLYEAKKAADPCELD